jgi:hypothetical protein
MRHGSSCVNQLVLVITFKKTTGQPTPMQRKIDTQTKRRQEGREAYHHIDALEQRIRIVRDRFSQAGTLRLFFSLVQEHNVDSGSNARSG